MAAYKGSTALKNIYAGSSALKNVYVGSTLVFSPGLVTTDYFQTDMGTLSTIGNTELAAHGLGAQPSFVQLALECISADAGYAVGDRVHNLVPLRLNGSNGNGFTVWGDATNIGYGIDVTTTIKMPHKTDHTIDLLTNSKWKVIMIGFKSAIFTFTRGNLDDNNQRPFAASTTAKASFAAYEPDQAFGNYSVGDYIFHGTDTTGGATTTRGGLGFVRAASVGAVHGIDGYQFNNKDGGNIAGWTNRGYGAYTYLTDENYSEFTKTAFTASGTFGSHGGSGHPVLVWPFVTPVVANHGWSIGDKMQMSMDPLHNSAFGLKGGVIWTSTTQIGYAGDNRDNLRYYSNVSNPAQSSFADVNWSVGARIWF